MRWRSEATLCELIDQREGELVSLLTSLRDPLIQPPEELLALGVELQDLRNELEFVRGNPSSGDEPEALVRAPLSPLPPVNSGSVALPRPIGDD